jgi:hypothetical protein
MAAFGKAYALLEKDDMSRPAVDPSLWPWT